MTKEELLIRFFEVAARNERHAFYDLTIARSKKYRQYVAGDNMDELLQQFVRREDKEMFKQRVALTKHITKSICKNLMDVFFKVPRSNTARRILSHQDEKKAGEINEILRKFWGPESFDDYLATRYIELNHIDPNAFVVIEFDEFDNEQEIVQPYPFEVFSQNAVDYKYQNRILQYLIVKGSNTLKSQLNPVGNESLLNPKKEKKIKGEVFTLYTRNVC